MKFFPLSLLLACGVFINAVSAEQLSGLYEAVVPVDSQSTADMQKATASGLAMVFVRMSGRADTIQYPEIKRAVGNPRPYLKQYSYRSERDAVAGSEQLQLVLEFEPGLVDGQLRAAGLPLWSGNRPSILLWLVIDDNEGRRIVGAETSPEGFAAIQSNARRRGLPINLPLLDLEDNIAISADALWALDGLKAEQASTRYQPDTLLIGKASLLSSGKWLGAWQFSFEGQTIEFETEASDLDTFVGRAVDRVAEILSEQYAIVPVSIAQDGILMRLDGIRTFTDYARAVHYLEGLAAIRSANVVTIDGDQITLRLFAEGQLQQLEQAISRDGVLMPARGSRPLDSAVLMNYRWPDSSVDSKHDD